MSSLGIDFNQITERRIIPVSQLSVCGLDKNQGTPRAKCLAKCLLLKT